MNLEDFQKFIDEQHDFYESLGDPNDPYTEKEHIFARTIKISEEFGELCDEVLAYFGKQRQSKMEEKDKDSLADEFADVLITTFMLAKSLNISIPEALDRKTKKIREKHNKELQK